MFSFFAPLVQKEQEKYVKYFRMQLLNAKIQWKYCKMSKYYVLLYVIFQILSDILSVLACFRLLTGKESRWRTVPRHGSLRGWCEKHPCILKQCVLLFLLSSSVTFLLRVWHGSKSPPWVCARVKKEKAESARVSTGHDWSASDFLINTINIRFLLSLLLIMSEQELCLSRTSLVSCFFSIRVIY